MRIFLPVIAIVALLACSTGAQQPPAGQDAAARVGDRTITLQQIEDRWRQNDPAGSAQAAQALYDGRRAALDDLVASMLIEAAAKAKGQTPAQFADAEIARRVKPVSESDVAVFYGENRAQMQGRTLEEMSGLIRQFLGDRQQQAARAAMIAELRKSGPPVRVMLEAPRQQIAIAADDPALGPATAPVTMVEFSDFQCPFCQRVAPTIKQIKAKYGDRVRIVWKDFPLTQIHPQAFNAAQAGNCAREQGKFWEYHDQLFANQATLQPDALKKYATAAGLNAATFATCLDSAKFQPKVQAALDAGARLGVSSTPTVFINGRRLAGAQSMEVFEGIIDEELQKAGK